MYPSILILSTVTVGIFVKTTIVIGNGNRCAIYNENKRSHIVSSISDELGKIPSYTRPTKRISLPR